MFKYFIFGVIVSLIKGAECEVAEVFAEPGSQAVLPCEHSSSPRVSPAIYWSKAGKGTIWRKQRSGVQFWDTRWMENGVQRVRCPFSHFHKSDYSMLITRVKEEDGGQYSCRVEHGRRVTEYVVVLRIIKVSVSPSAPIWGHDVSFSCSVTPRPDQAHLRWMFNDSPVVPDSKITSDAKQIVVRKTATTRLTGNWTCVVDYKGKQERASVALNVKGITEPAEDDTKVYAAVGSTVKLPCVFSPDLDPTRPLWEKLKPVSLLKPTLDNLPASFSLSSSSSSSSQRSWDKSAILKEVRYEDQGRYRCSGAVDGQLLMRNMQLVAVRVDSSVTSKKEAAMTLTCQLSDEDGVTGYEWVHVGYDPNGTRSVVAVRKGKTLDLSKESEENGGEWVCQFYGRDGVLGNVTYHVHQMSGLSGEKPSPAPSHNTAAMVGLSFLLTVLLLVLAQMYKNHQRRKRLIPYPALETIVHANSNEREERERGREKK